MYEILFLLGAVTYYDTPCPPGRYCPPGTTHADEFLCPVGTYYNFTKAKEVSDCVYCPGGHYCETEGLDYPTGLCDPGKHVKIIIESVKEKFTFTDQ